MANDGKLVFSTDGRGDARKTKDTPAPKPTAAKPGTVKMRLESAGRGGKQVTVVFALPFGEADATALLKELQGKLGTGGTYKDQRLEFRGDLRDRVEAILTKRGLKVVRAGG